MGNLDQEYNEIYDMLDKVSHRPGMYIGSNNLNDLVTYIFGYQACNRQHKHRYRSLYPLPFELFTSYCAMKFHMSGSMGYGPIILEVCHQDQEQALHQFFEVLDEFCMNAHVTMCRMCELAEENMNYHLTGKGVRRIIGSYSHGTEQDIPAYQSVKQFYHMAFSYGADLLIPVSNDKMVSGQLFYASTGGSGLEVFEQLEVHMESNFGGVSWRELELTDEDILLLLNDYYFNHGKTKGIKPGNSN